MKRVQITLLLILGILSWELHAGETAPDEPIRIGILVKSESFILSGTGEYTVTDSDSGKEKTFPGETPQTVVNVSNSLVVGEEAFDSGILRVETTEGALTVNGRKYRGALLIKTAGPSNLTVINELSLNEYIYGILPKEVSPSWPAESLKAQAVVSRTFALRNLGRHGSEGFNLCARVHCQVYGGLGVEHETTNRAVDDTRCDVLFHKDELANTVFFSNCGSKTEDPRNAWDTGYAPPYLRPVRCSYCKREPHYRWKKTVSQGALLEALKPKHSKIKAPIKSITIVKHGSSGRAKWLKIKHGGGEFKIRAGTFRMAVSPDVVRSTFFTEIYKTKKGFRFEGRGWGHGVGFCQEGAKGMAQKKINYKKILKHYYPGTKLETLGD